MNTIEYYSITDGYDDGKLPDVLRLNYSSKEKAMEAVLKNFKPRFDSQFHHIHDNLRFNGKYQNYNNLYRFSEDCYGNYSGYYEIIIGETQTKVEEDTIEFFAELFIKFTTAENIYAPEIKVAGQPYQPAKKEIKKIQETGPLPLYQCKRYSNHYIYGLESNMDNWNRTFRATIQDNLYINHDTLEIH